MTRRLAFAALAIAAAVGCASYGARGGLPNDRVAALPPEVKDAYDLFAQRCSRCHTLSRPLDANITDFEHWRVYVARMRRHPGSGISVADAEKILVFLKYYAEEKRRELEPQPEPEKPPPAPEQRSALR